MAKSYDIFNGDADGICALHQLRLDDPRAAELVTGVKRDIGLLERVDAQPGDELTVLDISMKVNAMSLARALANGARVRWFDHHASGTIPAHAQLEPHIDTSPDVCTSLIVDGVLGGRHRMWAVVAAFGDNLVSAAVRAAQPLELDHTELARLHELGDCLNYNAYGRIARRPALPSRRSVQDPLALSRPGVFSFRRAGFQRAEKRVSRTTSTVPRKSSPYLFF